MSGQAGWKLKAIKWMMSKGINYWAPFLGAGIKVVSTSKDMTTIRVELRETPFNRNIVGVHFGGSLYAMCDPFFMGILLHHLQHDFIVWDKAAAIKFLKPGRGTVHATFTISLGEIQAIKKRAEEAGKTDETFKVNIYDEKSNIIAEVEKLIYVRHKHTQKKPS
jgi:acyl-coenzyme A thioesterase PaaI-like protein